MNSPPSSTTSAAGTIQLTPQLAQLLGALLPQGNSGATEAPSPQVQQLQNRVEEQDKTIAALKNDFATLKRRMEEGEDSGSTGAKATKRRKALAWFQLPLKDLGSAKRSALKKLRALVSQVVDEALWIRKREFVDADDEESDEDLPEDERTAARERRLKKREERAGWTKLPRPDEIRDDDDGAQSFQVDFTVKHSDPENKDLMAHVVETVQERLEAERITPAHIEGCPEITTDVVEHLFRKRFETLKAEYKVQTDEAAAAKRKVKNHNSRMRTLQSYKFETRSKAASVFRRTYGKCPLKVLDPDYMSADESAGEDEDLQKSYYDSAGVAEADRTGPHRTRVVATQQLKWRAPWVTVVYRKLDEIYQQFETRGHQHKKRVPCGPIITTMPKTIPPACMLDARWVLEHLLENPESGNGVPDPEGWGPAEDEEKRWLAPVAATAA